jgi:hypothetical protein
MIKRTYALLLPHTLKTYLLHFGRAMCIENCVVRTSSQPGKTGSPATLKTFLDPLHVKTAQQTLQMVKA